MLIRARSISSRLTIWFSSVFFFGLLLFGAVMWLDLRDTLMAGRARTLDRRADRLSDLLREIEPEPQGSRAAKLRAFAEATGGGLIQLFSADGVRTLPAPSPAASTFPWPKVNAAMRQRYTEVTYAGQPYLVLSRPFLSNASPLVLCVAAPLEGNRPILRTFSVGLLWIAPVLLALSAIGGYAISRKALRPVDQITAATRSISLSNLSERLPVPETHDELQRLSETCNAMLARLESAVNEIQRFTADASHELRSPLSFIRTVAEVALRSRSADPESQRSFEEIVEECGKASRLLDDMLTLARAHAGDARFAFEPVNIADLVTAACKKVRSLPAAQNHRVVVCMEDARHTAILGDYSSLHRLFWILLENAVKYTAGAGTIRVSAESSAGELLVSVEDNGIGISASDLPQIFQRFYRADPSRGHVEGSGLGLAIAKCIADVHHARLSVTSTTAVGSRFQVVFPVWSEATGSVSQLSGRDVKN